jgi:hypothetical protein
MAGLVPAIHVSADAEFLPRPFCVRRGAGANVKVVDGRVKPGHDDKG